jgi:hypothetical protein
MEPILIILIVVVAALTLYSLVRGVIAMANGKDATGQQSQNWMRKRVKYQALAVVFVVLLLLLAGGS